MSKQAAIEMIKIAQTDSILKEQLENAHESQEVVKIGSEKGYEFTEEELVIVMAEQSMLSSEELELSDSELESVAGGIKLAVKYNGPW